MLTMPSTTGILFTHVSVSVLRFANPRLTSAIDRLRWSCQMGWNVRYLRVCCSRPTEEVIAYPLIVLLTVTVTEPTALVPLLVANTV